LHALLPKAFQEGSQLLEHLKPRTGICIGGLTDTHFALEFLEIIEPKILSMSFKWDDLKAEMERQAEEEKADGEKKRIDAEARDRNWEDTADAPEWQTDKILTGEVKVPEELRAAMKQESPETYDIVFMRYLRRRPSSSAIQEALEKEWELRYEELGEQIHGLHDYTDDLKSLPRFKDMDTDKMSQMQENAAQGAEKVDRMIDFIEGFQKRVLLPARNHVGLRTWNKIITKGPLSEPALQGYKCVWWCQRSITRMNLFAKPAKFARFFARKSGIYKG
jgi:hypothetical protein